jgi:hypothetical protein
VVLDNTNFEQTDVVAVRLNGRTLDLHRLIWVNEEMGAVCFFEWADPVNRYVQWGKVELVRRGSFARRFFTEVLG